MAKKNEHAAIIIDKSELDMNSPVPLYEQLAKIITRKIEDGLLKQGDILPTEMYLCETLGLSRSTVRNTMLKLEREGRLTRRRGKGTYVTVPKLRRSLNNMYNFSLEMNMMGQKPSSQLISFHVEKADIVTSEYLGIHEGDPIYKIVRLRMADDLPMLLEKAYIPTVYCPNLREEELSDSLYAMLSEYTGHMPMKAVETYEAITLTDKHAALLKCKAKSPAFKIRRVSENTNHDVFEYCIIIAPGERNRYEITLTRNNDMFLTRKI